MKKLAFILLCLNLTTACTNESNNPDPVNPVDKKVLIINRGYYWGGNASLGVYNTNKKEYTPNVFKSTNGKHLGNLFESATQVGNEVYLVLNNSNKIEVIDTKTYKSTGTILGLNNPLYMLPISSNEAIVTDLYYQLMRVVNLSKKEIVRSISTESVCERPLMIKNKLYLTGYKDYITVVDLSADSLFQIKTTFYPSAIKVDKNDKIWVYCFGGGPNLETAALEVIDPISNKVEKTINLRQQPVNYANLAFNATNDSLFFNCGDIFKMSIEATSMPVNAFISGSSFTNLYGMDYNVDSKELWVTDALDFEQDGEVLIYDVNGKLKTSFKAGIAPKEFLFVK